ISWKSIKEVSFKEEFFGSKFICVPQQGENIVTEYIPKVQVRKLYQVSYEQLESYKEQQRLNAMEEKRTAPSPVTVTAVADESATGYKTAQFVSEEPEDETTLKLRKLKSLYDKQLITQEEYETKKA